MASFSAVGSKCRQVSNTNTPIFSSTDIKHSAEELMDASLAVNTSESYAKGIKSFEEFRQLYGLTRGWPPAIQQLIEFVSYLSLNPFPNDKYLTVPNSKSLQTTILNVMKMAESYPIS